MTTPSQDDVTPTIVVDLGRSNKTVDTIQVKIIKKDVTDKDSALIASNGVGSPTMGMGSPIMGGAASPAGARGSPVPQVPNGKPPGPPGSQTTTPTLAQGQHTVSNRDPKAAAAAAIESKHIVRRKLTGFVGFANLPNQWHRKSVRKGFNFNVMVVGELLFTYVKR